MTSPTLQALDLAGDLSGAGARPPALPARSTSAVTPASQVAGRARIGSLVAVLVSMGAGAAASAAVAAWMVDSIHLF
jgi:hypothetical protein